jgi:hypothetical protein
MRVSHVKAPVANRGDGMFCVHDEILDARYALFIVDHPPNPLFGLGERFGLGVRRGWRSEVAAGLEHAHHCHSIQGSQSEHVQNALSQHSGFAIIRTLQNATFSKFESVQKHRHDKR